MKEGDVIRIAFPQKDQKHKFRPGVILKRLPPFDDFLVCGVSSNLEREVKGFDILIDKTHPDFDRMGLPFPSLIRLGFLGTFSLNLIEGKLGTVSPATHQKLIRNLKSAL